MKTSSRIVFLLSTLFILCACTVSKTTEVASLAAEKFHQQFRESRFREIYEEASTSFKNSQTAEETLKVLTSARAQFGNLRTAKRTGWVIEPGKKGDVATLHYNIEFENGPAVARFAYEVTGDRAQLLEYEFTAPRPARVE